MGNKGLLMVDEGSVRGLLGSFPLGLGWIIVAEKLLD